MNGWGYHYSRCHGGGDAKVILAGGGFLACAFAVEWVASHAWEILAVTAACGALAVSAVVALMRWTDRRAAAFGAALAARRERPALTATVLPQVSQPERPAIPQVVNFNFYGTGPMAARVIRQAIPGPAGTPPPKGTEMGLFGSNDSGKQPEPLPHDKNLAKEYDTYTREHGAMHYSNWLDVVKNDGR